MIIQALGVASGVSFMKKGVYIMSEEKVEEQVEESVEAPSKVSVEEMVSKPEIGNELKELGHQLSAATKAVLESPEAQQFRTQLQQGLESLSKSIDKLSNQARETQVGKKVESGVTEAASTMKERRVLETLAESVATALQTVNQSLAREVEKVQSRAEKAKSEPQKIEIVEDQEAPAESEDQEG